VAEKPASKRRAVAFGTGTDNGRREPDLAAEIRVQNRLLVRLGKSSTNS
jgi:hypothetical protein